MSRCFPFPPPGYEKAARSDSVELLLKEKDKEKTHKKEKRDKEKRESKERKDRSKDKRKEKKDRKEKHRDKKKDKDREKQKSKLSEDRTEERKEDRHEDKLGQSSQKVEEIKDSKFTAELARRIRDEQQQAANRMADACTSSIQQRTEAMGAANALEKERVSRDEMVPGIIRTVQRGNDVLGRPMEGLSMSMQRRTEGTATKMEKQRGMFNEKIPDATTMDHQRNHGMGQQVDKSAGSIQRTHGMCTTTATNPTTTTTVVAKERGSKNNSIAIGAAERTKDGIGQPFENPSSLRRTDGIFTALAMEKERVTENELVPSVIVLQQRIHDRMGWQGEEDLSASIQKRTEGMGASRAVEKKRVEGKESPGNLIGTEQRKSDGTCQVVGKNSEKKIEAKEKIKNRKPEDGKGDRHTDKDRSEKKSKTKDKDRHKRKKKEKEKTQEKDKQKHKELDKQRDSGKKDQLDCTSIKPLAPHGDNTKIAGADRNIKKRKDFEINGFLHEKEALSNKIARITPLPHLPVENGRTMELSHIASTCSKLGAVNNEKAEKLLDNKEKQINGIAESQPSSVELRHAVALDHSENGGVSSRLPHRDSKHLSLIYTVPKMEEWPEHDDQQWLFSSDNLRPKANLEADRTPQVWAEAMQIDSDVLALPYVIPF